MAPHPVNAADEGAVLEQARSFPTVFMPHLGSLNPVPTSCTKVLLHGVMSFSDSAHPCCSQGASKP